MSDKESKLLRRAVFLDRDGVLIEEVDLLTRAADIHILAGIPQALAKLKHAGFSLMVVSNQTVIARGLSTEAEVTAINQEIAAQIVTAGGPTMDAFYICPHHPKATLPEYRVNCECRKPEPGMLLAAAREHGLELASSFMIGDRITDIIAGARAGCRTILVKTGAHALPPIETVEPIDKNIRADFECASLVEAADWILKQR